MTEISKPPGDFEIVYTTTRHSVAEFVRIRIRDHRRFQIANQWPEPTGMRCFWPVDSALLATLAAK